VQGFDQQVAALNTLAAANQQISQLVEDLSGQVAKLYAEVERITRRVEAEAVARKGLQQGLQAGVELSHAHHD
jgi:archaellum component FlaC